MCCRPKSTIFLRFLALHLAHYVAAHCVRRPHEPGAVLKICGACAPCQDFPFKPKDTAPATRSNTQNLWLATASRSFILYFFFLFMVFPVFSLLSSLFCFRLSSSVLQLPPGASAVDGAEARGGCTLLFCTLRTQCSRATAAPAPPLHALPPALRTRSTRASACVCVCVLTCMYASRVYASCFVAACYYSPIRSFKVDTPASLLLVSHSALCFAFSSP